MLIKRPARAAQLIHTGPDCRPDQGGACRRPARSPGRGGWSISLGSRLPPTPLGGRRVLVICDKLRFRCRRRRSRSCSSSSSRVHCRVRLWGTGGQRSLRVMPRASRWPASWGGAAGPDFTLHAHWNWGLLAWVSRITTAMGVHPHGHPCAPTGMGGHPPGLPGAWQGGHCSARRGQVNLAEPGSDLRLLDEQLLRNIPAPQLPQDVPDPQTEIPDEPAIPKGEPSITSLTT